MRIFSIAIFALMLGCSGGKDVGFSDNPCTQHSSQTSCDSDTSCQWATIQWSSSQGKNCSQVKDSKGNIFYNCNQCVRNPQKVVYDCANQVTGSDTVLVDCQITDSTTTPENQIEDTGITCKGKGCPTTEDQKFYVFEHFAMAASNVNSSNLTDNLQNCVTGTFLGGTKNQYYNNITCTSRQLVGLETSTTEKAFMKCAFAADGADGIEVADVYYSFCYEKDNGTESCPTGTQDPPCTVLTVYRDTSAGGCISSDDNYYSAKKAGAQDVDFLSCGLSSGS